MSVASVMCGESPHRVSGARPSPLASHRRYVSAWEPAAEHIARTHVTPVDGGHVTQIRCVGSAVGEDTGDVLVVLRESDRLGLKGIFDGEVEPSMAAD